jgi:acyl carrier protein
VADVADTVLAALASALAVRRSALGRDAAMHETPGWDSLATVRFIVALEDAFDHALELEAAEAMVSARAAIAYFEARERAAGG